jgi:hypothetical protein
MQGTCRATIQTLAPLFAQLARHGFVVIAWYEQDGILGLVLSSGHIVETVRRRALAAPEELGELLACHLPRASPPPDYDPLRVPEIDRRTGHWWLFLRWCHLEGRLEARP